MRCKEKAKKIGLRFMYALIGANLALAFLCLLNLIPGLAMSHEVMATVWGTMFGFLVVQ